MGRRLLADRPRPSTPAVGYPALAARCQMVRILPSRNTLLTPTRPSELADQTDTLAARPRTHPLRPRAHQSLIRTSPLRLPLLEPGDQKIPRRPHSRHQRHPVHQPCLFDGDYPRPAACVCRACGIGQNPPDGHRPVVPDLRPTSQAPRTLPSLPARTLLVAPRPQPSLRRANTHQGDHLSPPGNRPGPASHPTHPASSRARCTTPGGSPAPSRS